MKPDKLRPWGYQWHYSWQFILHNWTKGQNNSPLQSEILKYDTKKSGWKSKRNPDQNLPLRQTRRGVPYNQIGSPLVLGGESGTRKFSEQTFARELKLSGLSQLSTFNFHRVFRTTLFLHYASGLRSAVWLLWNFKSFPASARRAEMWSFIALFGGGMDHLRDVSAVDTCDCVCLCK